MGGDEFCSSSRRRPAPTSWSPAPQRVRCASTATGSRSRPSFGIGHASARGEHGVRARSASPTSGCTRRRQAGASRRASSRAACCSRLSRAPLRSSSAHVASVAELAEALALRLGLSPGGGRAYPTRGRAARRRQDGDPGRDPAKPGPLTDDELAFVRRHTLIGERILLAAPALAHVAGDRPLEPRALRRHRLPRRPGRRGDPARLADRLRVRRVRDPCLGEPVRGRRGATAALNELRRSAGTHFDPVVVEALAGVVAGRGAAKLALVS